MIEKPTVIARIPDQGHWNIFHDPRPYVTTMGICFDQHGNFPVQFRSDKVRSAKNAWSLPCGLHEVGYTLPEQLDIELWEELKLRIHISTAKIVGVYENLALVDGYHWVIVLMTTQLKTHLSRLINKEPDKHSKIEIVNYMEAAKVLNRPWTPGLGEAMHRYYWDICRSIESTLFPSY